MLIHNKTLLRLILLVLLLFVKVINQIVELFDEKLRLPDVPVLLVLEMCHHFVELFFVVGLFVYEAHFFSVDLVHLFLVFFVPFDFVVVV